MPRLLLLYGTTDGQTGRIGAFLRDRFEELGIRTDLRNAAESPPEQPLVDYDALIVTASIHVAGFQRPVTRWLARHAAEIQPLPSAFLPVCLAVLESKPATRADVERIVGRFQARTGWCPGQVKFVAGALRYTRYGWLKRWVMRRISARAGGATDTSRDHEYTDWADLEAFARAFAERLTVRHFVELSG